MRAAAWPATFDTRFTFGPHGVSLGGRSKNETMAPTKSTINVELSAKQQAMLQRQLESGHYENANQVIQDALRLMDERDAMFDAWLRGEVNAAMADKRPSVTAETVFKRLEASHARRVRAPKRGK